MLYDINSYLNLKLASDHKEKVFKHEMSTMDKIYIKIYIKNCLDENR